MSPFARLFFLLVRLAARMLSSFVALRVGVLHYRSIGRLTSITEFFLRCRHAAGELRGWCVLLSGRPVNRPLLRLIGRAVPVVECGTVARWTEAAMAAHPDHPMWVRLDSTGHFRWPEWNAAPPQLAFTDAERRAGHALLSDLGIGEGRAYVCIDARDHGFTDDPDVPRSPADPWSYNDFRDCAIENFLPAARHLVQREISVVRMGLPLETPIAAEDGLMDYVHSGLRSEFGDLYLLAHCKFLVGCTAGLYHYASIFGVPYVMTNVVPLGDCGRTTRDLFIPKTYRSEGDGRPLAFAEAVALGLDGAYLTREKGRGLAERGIRIVENTAEDILDVTAEMNARLDGSWRDEPGDDARQARYRSLFPAGHPMTDFPSPVGAAFLRRHEALLP